MMQMIHPVWKFSNHAWDKIWSNIQWSNDLNLYEPKSLFSREWPFDSYDIMGLSLEFGNKTVNNFKVAMMESQNSLFIHEIREKS